MFLFLFLFCFLALLWLLWPFLFPCTWSLFSPFGIRDDFQLNSTTLSGHAFLSLNQKALRRSHVIHGLQQRCGNTIHSHVQILTPCLEVCALCSPKSIGLCGHFPIRCWLCHCRRIKQLMQYPPFSSPPIKGFVQKAVSTHRAFQSLATTFCLAAHAGILLRFSAAVVGWVKLCLHSLLLHNRVLDIGIRLPCKWSFSTRFCGIWRTWVHQSIIHAIVHVFVHLRLFLCFWCTFLGETFIQLRNRWLDPSLNGCSTALSCLSCLSCWSVAFAMYMRWHILQRSRSFLPSRSLGAAALLGYLIILASPQVLRVLPDTLGT